MPRVFWLVVGQTLDILFGGYYQIKHQCTVRVFPSFAKCFSKGFWECVCERERERERECVCVCVCVCVGEYWCYCAVCWVASVMSNWVHLQPYGLSLPGSSVHGILQARTLEWVAMLSSGDFPNSGIEPASLMSPAVAGGFFTVSTIWVLLVTSVSRSYYIEFSGCGCL